MSDEAQALVEQMVAARGWPKPRLLEAILEQREAAVAPLLEIVRREVQDSLEATTLCHACLLLGSLQATPAIPDLVELFYRYDSDLLDEVHQAVVMLGGEAVEPLLAVVRGRSLPWYPRAMASEAAIGAAARDQALQLRVAAALRELLADHVARAKTLEDGEVQMATTLVMDLAHLADLEARDLIAAAFEVDIVERWMIGPEDVTRYYRERHRASPPDLRAWLVQYRRDYREHLAQKRRRERESQAPKPRAVSSRKSKRREFGRNDPCWCGSGKKYKQCHLRQDQQR